MAMENSISIVQMVLGFFFVGSLFFIRTEGQEEYMTTSIAPMQKQEQEALYSAIQGFVGKMWNGSDLYPDPCGWTPIQGVSCDLYNGFWYVSAINVGPVYENSLPCSRGAKFTNHLFMLEHLRTLSFFNCFFSPDQNPVRIPISNWENFTNSLESLEFRSNTGLIGAIPNSIGYLKKLQSLVLLENGLTGELPPEIGNLVSLRRLVLCGNQFLGQIPTSYGQLTQLLILDFSRNNLSGLLPSSFGNLTSLLKLDLSNNMLGGELPTEIGSLRNLTVLDLRRNNLSGGLTLSLQEMVSLKEMVISNNPIGGDLNGIHWQNLQNLEFLDLSYMGLTGKIPESMTELKRLRFLGLNNNSLSGNLSPGLASLPCISSLYLYGNNLTGKLEFPEWFYRKIGKRFGVWNNPNLCHQAELISPTSIVPHGVKPCDQETVTSDRIPNAKMNTDKVGNWNQNNLIFAASLGGSGCRLNGLWWAFYTVYVIFVIL